MGTQGEVLCVVHFGASFRIRRVDDGDLGAGRCDCKAWAPISGRSGDGAVAAVGGEFAGQRVDGLAQYQVCNDVGGDRGEEERIFGEGKIKGFAHTGAQSQSARLICMCMARRAMRIDVYCSMSGGEDEFRPKLGRIRSAGGRSAKRYLGKLAAAIRSDQVLEAADVDPVDKDLRNRAAATGARQHLVPAQGIRVDADLGVIESFLLEQILGCHAVRADRRREHLY